MATQKQKDAARSNAQKSTGPKTEEGKRRSSRNALTHGLHSRDFLLNTEDPIAFSLFHEQLLHDHNPQTALELMLVEQILHSYFLSRRYATCLPELHEAAARGGKPVFHTYPVLMKLKNQADRMMHKAIEQLREIQAARRAAPNDEEPIWPEVEPAYNPDNPHDLHDLGFVLPNFGPPAQRSGAKHESSA